MAVCPLCNSSGELGAPCPEHPTWRLVDELQLEKYRTKGVLLGRVVADRFAIVRVLGKGGMGWVYEAIQEPIGRRLAVKVLRADHASDEIVRSRFFREAKVLGMLQHPNLVTLFDYGVVSVAPEPAMGGIEGDDPEELLFIGMELLRGQTLHDALARPRFVAARRLIDICLGVAGGLAEAHRNQVVHRDLKPENVLLVRDSSGREVVKLVDFGIARLSTASTVLTQTGMVFGTPAFMAPEQCAGEVDVGPQADSYAFGITLYKMLTDKLPFTGAKPLQLLMQQINMPPPEIVLRKGLTVPRALIDLCVHCLEKRPEDRPTDGAALVARLEQARADLGDAVELLEGALEPASADAEASTARGQISAKDALADLGEEDVDDTDQGGPQTIVLGGGVELDDAVEVPPKSPDAHLPSTEIPTEPVGLSPASADGAVAVDTIVSTPRKKKRGKARSTGELAEAYRVAPRTDGPSELRGSGGPSPMLLGGIGIGMLVLGLIFWAIASGGDDAKETSGDDEGTETPAATTATPTPDGTPTDGAATEGAPSDGAPTDGASSDGVPTEAGAGAGAVPQPAGPSDAALLEELTRLEDQLETQMLTATGEDHRREIQSDINRQMAPIRAELARRGVKVD